MSETTQSPTSPETTTEAAKSSLVDTIFDTGTEWSDWEFRAFIVTHRL